MLTNCKQINMRTNCLYMQKHGIYMQESQFYMDKTVALLIIFINFVANNIN